jgi:hypothetical protein
VTTFSSSRPFLSQARAASTQPGHDRANSTLYAQNAGREPRVFWNDVLVDGRRLELPTSALRTRRSPN